MMCAQRKPTRYWLALALTVVVGLLGALVGLLWRWKRRQRGKMAEAPPARITFDVQGLTQAEARARYQEGQSNAIHLHPVETRTTMIRKNALTVFNTGLVAIIFVQILLGKFLDALVSFGVLLFTIGVNVFQEEFARIRMRKVQEAAQPRAVVIRDGQVRSIVPDEIVAGDVVEFRPGDQIMVDGRLLQGTHVAMDETLVFGKSRKSEKKPGDEVYAGSLCLSGRGVMETTRIGEERFIVRRLQAQPPVQESMTPIERLIDRVLKWLLAFVLAIAAFLLTKYFRLQVPLPQASVDKFIDAIGVIFSIAPAGLFFMISLTYAASTVDLAKLRVLVHRARSIETLAQIDMIFLNKAGFILARWIEMKPVEQSAPEGEKPLSEMAIRKMLGTFARSISYQNQFTRSMQMAFEGLQLPPAEEMPFYAHYGWSGIRVESEELSGVLVIGDPDLLTPSVENEQPESQEKPKNVLARTTGRLGRLFRRSGPEASSPPPDRPESLQPAAAPAPDAAETVRVPEPEAEPPRKRGVLGRIRQGVGGALRRKSQAEPSPQRPQEEGETGETLLFAWSPDPQPLYDEAGQPRLSDGLIPLCRLFYQERANPQAVQALRAFAANGVASKLFDEGPVDGIREALQQAGADEALVATFRGVSAAELRGLSDEALAEAIIRHHLIGDAGAGFMARAVKALRQTGHLVGVLGSGAGELDAMMAADLGVTLISAPSGALSVADIVLMDTSPRVITAMIDKGQRIVNGLLDVLKLYLTQAFYLLFLVGALLFFLRSFPYRGAQGGLIAAFALSIPALALTLTAQPGRLQVKNVSGSLFAFVIPASIAIAVAGYWIFARFLQAYDDQAYAQIALVHGLIAMGLLLANLLRPPLKLRRSVIPISFQRFLPTIVALISGAIFLITTFIPLAQKFLYVTPLKSAADYTLVGSASLAWAVAFGAYWFIVTELAHWLRATRVVASRYQ